MIKSASVLMLCAAPLLAQSERHAALGDRVRVHAPRAGYRSLTGEITATTPDALQVRINGGTEIAVMRAQIDELQLSLSSRRNTRRGATVGFVIGGVGAFLFGPKEVKAVNGGQAVETGKAPAINVITAAVGGAAIGALVGYYARSDTWVSLSPRP